MGVTVHLPQVGAFSRLKTARLNDRREGRQLPLILEMFMLTSLVLTLTTDHPLTFPAHLGRAQSGDFGRASHAAFLRLIAGADPALAERLHAPDERRPFTCSDLWGARRRGGRLILPPDRPVYLRYTGLTAKGFQHLQRCS